MFNLIIKLCIASGCYSGTALQFPTMKECGEALIVLRDTKQVSYKSMYCEKG